MSQYLVRRIVELGLLIALIFALVTLLRSPILKKAVSEQVAAAVAVPTATLPSYPSPQPTPSQSPPPNSPTPIPPTQTPAPPPESCKFLVLTDSVAVGGRADDADLTYLFCSELIFRPPLFPPPPLYPPQRWGDKGGAEKTSARTKVWLWDLNTINNLIS